MDPIFSHHGNQKFRKLRACPEDTLPKILPHLVIKVPASHFAPRISQLPPPFNLFMNVQLIFMGGGGYPSVCFQIENRPNFAQRTSFPVIPTIGGPGEVKIEDRKYIRSHFVRSVHAPFTLVHVISRYFTLFLPGGRGRFHVIFHNTSQSVQIEDRKSAFENLFSQLSTTNPCVQPSENTRQTHGKHT